MSKWPAEREPVGDPKRTAFKLQLAIASSKAARLANGRWQCRKINGIWCTISPRGIFVPYLTAAAARSQTFRLAKVANGSVSA